MNSSASQIRIQCSNASRTHRENLRIERVTHDQIISDTSDEKLLWSTIILKLSQ